MPPTREQEEWERAIGHRGEEIVYKREVARVKASGGDESKVVWVSQDNPGSDFDINSIDGDGKTLWIEVKSTSGSDGRFRWSKAEFDRARKHRNPIHLVSSLRGRYSYTVSKGVPRPCWLALE